MATAREKLQAKYGVTPQANAPVVPSARQRLQEKYKQPQVLPQQSAYQRNVVEPLSNFSTGFAKGALSTVRGIGQIGENIGNVVLPERFEPKQSLYQPDTELGASVQEALKPQGTAENIGYGTEKVAEFFIPAGKAGKVEKALTTATKGMKPLAGSLTRILGKSAVQGTAAGGVNFVQSGGDVQESLKTALTAGIVRGSLATGGEVTRNLKIPERLYNVIFKNSKKDMLQELRGDGLVDFQNKYPDEFKRLVQSGVVRVGEKGAVLNETVAEEALRRGLSGSIRNMSNEVVRNTFKTEDKIRNILANKKVSISVKEPQIVNVLDDIVDDYANVGLGEVSVKAKGLSDAIKSGKGTLDGTTALELRRFLDGMRLTSSFDKPVSKLSMTQSNFKTLSDVVRGRLNEVEGVGGLMKDYSFYIDALEELAKEGAKRGNTQVLGLVDSLFLGGASVSNTPAIPLGIAAGRRIVQSPSVLTGTAQKLSKGALSPVTSAGIGAGSSALTNILGSRQSDQ